MRVAIGGLDIVGDETAVFVELRHEERGRATLGVNAEREDWVVVWTYKYHTCA